MSDDTDDAQKTEEPTGKRLADARKKGQVATSREVNTWMILFGTGVMLAMLAPALMSDLRVLLTGFFERPHQVSFESGALGAFMTDRVKDVGAILALPFLLFSILAIFTNVSQIGFLFTPEPMKPKFSKISPLKGLKRWFSARHQVEFLKGLLKIVIVGALGVILLLPEMNDLKLMPSRPIGTVLTEINDLVLKLMVVSLAILFVISVADLFFQRFQHIKQLRMTKQEVKEEFKNMEGDPQVKSRLRQIRMERARSRMMQAVPQADVVVTNPTHFAVALVYDPEKMDAPKVVAKGQDILAHRIRDIANENDVPIVENPPLARALYAGVEIEESVPPEHFKAVAEVISYVFNLKGRKMPD